MVKIGMILHPTDFSESSKHALDYALAFAGEFGARVFVLHVIEEMAKAMYFDMLQAPPMVEIMADIEAQANTALRELVPEEYTRKLKLEYLVRKGVPFLEIVRCAKEIKADIIVCGTHGRTGLKHVFFGSVAEKIVRKAPCPVLSVRHPKLRFEMPT